MAHVADMHGDLEAASSRWLFKSPLAGAGAYCGGTTTGCTACVPRTGFGVVRIDPLRFLARCLKRRL